MNLTEDSSSIEKREEKIFEDRVAKPDNLVVKTKAKETPCTLQSYIEDLKRASQKKDRESSPALNGTSRFHSSASPRTPTTRCEVVNVTFATI